MCDSFNNWSMPAKASLSQIDTPELPLEMIDLSSEHELQLKQQAVQKLDYTILPVIALMYFLSILVCPLDYEHHLCF